MKEKTWCAILNILPTVVVMELEPGQSLPPSCGSGFVQFLVLNDTSFS